MLPSRPAIYLLSCTAIIALLLLSAFNIENYLAPKEILGVETQKETNEQFWTDFLAKNPNYIPGWIELERWDKVIEIDPNFLLQP